MEFPCYIFDEIVLKNGQIYKGKITYMDSEILKFETEFGKLEIPRDKIKKGSFTSSENISQTKVLIDEDWENGTIGNKWDIIEMCDHIPRISNNSFKDSYSMEVIDHTGHDGPNIQNKDPFNSKNIYIEFYYKNEEPRNGGRTSIVIKDSVKHQKNLEKPNFFSHVLINSQLEFNLFNNSMSERKVLHELKKNEWYKITFKIYDDKLKIYIDNDNIYEGKVNLNSQINYLQFGAGSNWEQGPRYYIDNIKVKTL